MGHPPGLENSPSRALPRAAQASNKPCPVIWGGRGQEPMGHALLPGPSLRGVHGSHSAPGLSQALRHSCAHTTRGGLNAPGICEGKERQAPGSVTDPGNSSSDSGTGAQVPSFIQRNTCLPVT